jgi:hypothetical protein
MYRSETVKFYLNTCCWHQSILRYIASSSSSADYSPLLDIGLSNSHLAWSSATRIQLPPAVLRKSSLHLAWGRSVGHTTFTETRSPFQNSFTPAVDGSTADMVSPLPLQHASTVCYVGDLHQIHRTFNKIINFRQHIHTSTYHSRFIPDGVKIGSCRK